MVLPQCAYTSRTIRVPVLMVEWEDFDPANDPANENNPDSVNPGYVPSTPDQLSAFLNGPSGPSQYFRDVSGGRTELGFDVFGWIRSDAPGSYLRPRASYLYERVDISRWFCRRDEVFLDALRDGVVAHGLDLTAYDADANGVMDGAVLLYEGVGGLCSGGNLSYVDPSIIYPSDLNPWSFDFPNGTGLVSEDSPHRSLFDTQSILFNFYNNMPERLPPGDSFYHPATWTHELGHLLLSYPDYYWPRFEVDGWAMSGSHGANPSHPAAFEKWLFARWLEPVVIDAPGTHSLAANEIPDGSDYDQGPYLYVLYIEDDPNHFLVIENRWFDAAGNSHTQWAPADGRESGLAIFEFDLTRGWFQDDPPQVLRHHPSRASGATQPPWRAYQPGDLFSRCYLGTCITIQPLSEPGASVLFSVDIESQDVVILHSAVIDQSDNVTVTYSKSFETCAHLMEDDFRVTHVQSFFCDVGEYVAITRPLSDFDFSDDQVKLCHGNDSNICSELVAIETLPPICGDDVVNQPGEACDGTSDLACPGLCRSDCTCELPICGDGSVNQIDEECDGSDDSVCPGLCQSDCLCAPDSDGDGVSDSQDNCIDVLNSQFDADSDGYGNACDCDFDNDGNCDIDDFSAFIPDFVAGLDSGSGTDMSSDSFVNIDDFALFVPGFVSGSPGPSALAP
ncbi:MAG: hypothetical protein JRG83_18055 [Deltaproteobacteria bacterium]|nr:hypothetical protein [Deltaproteobacteria bacterium]